MVQRRIKENIEKQSKEKEVKYRKLRHQKHQKYARQRYLEEVGIKAAREMMKTKLEMWDIGNDIGNERYCWCGNLESSEHILECCKVKEIIDKNEEKEWLDSGKSDDLLKAMEFIKSFIEKRDQ